MDIYSFLFLIIPVIPSISILLFIQDNAILYMVGVSAFVGLAAYLLTRSLVPVVAEFTLKKGLCGKDLGKKGTIQESKDIPEALGIVPGTIYIVCAIFSQLFFCRTDKQMMISNSALFSICFMVFLGFCDDTLELAWRYKLILPTIASVPLLAAYTGSTAVFIPNQFRFLFLSEGRLTLLGAIVNIFAVVDTEAGGNIIELGHFFLLFMGLLAVFCTNSINIYAGINGLECGQSYVIACSILFFKLYDVFNGFLGENQIFALLMIIPFIGTSLGLLSYNWFPAEVFVGDTFCYFAGMTFAVVGIHGHFSKTLLLLFIPQIFNFVYSIPQLFKIIPCPRHRLPRADPKTHLLHCSTFACESNQYSLFKRNRTDLECPNCTLICLVLRITGPLTEKTLCIVLLSIQILCSVIVFYCRYVLFEQ